MASIETSARDQWAAWLLQRRHGGDPEELRRTLDRLQGVRERVLDNGGVAEGQTLLDVGTGEGLIAFGALDRVGSTGQVILSDVSQDLLDHAAALADQLGVRERCRFVLASADDLSEIADGSVDVVTTRSVMAYVQEKGKAFAEMARVLRPGGRISLYEPINRHIAHEPPGQFFGYDVTPVQDLAARVNAAYLSRQDLESDPMFDFDERDLLALAESTGFEERHLELHIDVTRHPPHAWDAFANAAPNPLAPTLSEAIAETLSPADAERFVAHLRPLVERSEGTFAVAFAYVWGVKG